MSDFSLPLSTHEPFIFLSSVQLRRGVIQRLWWAPGIHPGSKHHEKRKRERYKPALTPFFLTSDFCHIVLTLVTVENVSKAHELLAKKTCLWLNQWIASRLSLLCLCMCCCLSFWSLIILIGLNFSVRIDAAYQISSSHHESTYILLSQT